MKGFSLIIALGVIPCLAAAQPAPAPEGSCRKLNDAFTAAS